VVLVDALPAAAVLARDDLPAPVHLVAPEHAHVLVPVLEGVLLAQPQWASARSLALETPER
jgi:hypothetical protein